MKIGVINASFPNLTESFVRREVEALRDLGHEVRVFTRADAVDYQKVPVPAGITVARWYLEDLLEFKPDVLYGEISLESHNRTAVLSDEFKIPFALRIWAGLDTFTRPTPAFYGPLSKRPECLGFIVEDSYMADWAVEKMGIDRQKLAFVPNSVDPVCYLERNPSPAPVVLAIGRFVEKKGFEYLVKAAQRISDRNISFELVGDGYLMQRLRAHAPKSVSFLGIRPESELPGMYAKAWMLVAPCIEVTDPRAKSRHGDADGIPTVVLEAMAAGCPVIASNLKSAPCYIENEVTGLLVPPADAIALAGAIQRLVSDRTLATTLGGNARAWALRHLDIRTNVKTIESMLSGGQR